MKKICLVSTFSYPLFNSSSNISFGGSEVQISNLSKQLSNDKYYEISVILRNNKDEGLERIGNVNIYNYSSLKNKKFNFIKSPFKFWMTLYKIKPDIIICRANGLSVFYSVVYSFFNSKKVIYMIAHDEDICGKFFKGLVGKLFFLGFKFSDFFVAQNLFQYELYKEKFKKNNIEMIKNSFFIKTQEIKKKKTILYVARADSWKRPELFIKLAMLYSNEKFVMIMNKGNQIDVWNKYSKLAKKQKNIKFIEKVAFKDSQKYFDEAKVFINTSKDEGFPNTFIQACLGKTPILSLNVNPSNFITKNKLGLVSNDNFNKFVSDFDRMLTDQKLWQTMSVNVLEYVKREHNIEKNIKQLENIFKSLQAK